MNSMCGCVQADIEALKETNKTIASTIRDLKAKVRDYNRDLHHCLVIIREQDEKKASLVAKSEAKVAPISTSLDAIRTQFKELDPSSSESEDNF